MGDTEAIILVGGLILFGSVAVISLHDRSQKKFLANQAAASAQRQRRMDNPDFEGLERYFGRSLPAGFRRMYEDSELINSTDLLIGVANPLEETDDCYIAWFEPADTDTAASVWKGCEGLFPFANNGAGDSFMVDLRQADPDVIYHLHETNERKAIGVTLSAFLSASRRPVPEE